MKKHKILIIYRISLVVLFFIVQVAWFFLFFLKLMDSMFISIPYSVLSLWGILQLLRKKDNTPYKIGWGLLIITLPLLGAIYYLLFKNKNRFQKLADTLELEHEILKQALNQDEQVIKEIGNKRVIDLAYSIQTKSDYPIYRNVFTEYYPVGEAMFEAMLPEIEKAKHFIFIEFFLIEESKMWDRILDILQKKALQGIDVRIIYDDTGCLNLLPLGYAKQLERSNPNIKCVAFNPFVPLMSFVMSGRDHRKIVVVDGHTAFTGGMNLGDEYINKKTKYGHWRDNGVMLKGEAVWNFTAMFLEMWNASRGTKEEINPLKPERDTTEGFIGDGYIQPFGETPFDKHTVGKDVYIQILRGAKKYVYICTPYLVIGKEMKAALCLAAKRGVDVRIITPGIPDKKMVFRITRSNYKELLKSGVKIYEYTPGFMHSKSYVCDDEIAVVGSINMEYLSLYLHFECATFMYKTSAVMDLKQDYIETIEKGKEITHSVVKL